MRYATATRAKVLCFLGFSHSRAGQEDWRELTGRIIGIITGQEY